MSHELKCTLRMPSMPHLLDHIRYNSTFAKRMVTYNSRKGKSVVICGAGPSLSDHMNDLPEYDEVWACNSALPYLMDRGVRVTHGFCIDQGAEMLNPNEWERTFDVDYLVSSSINPHLTDHLLYDARQLTWFHNYLGAPDSDGYQVGALAPTEELEMYRKLFDDSVCVGYGLNAVPRAACLALAMGFDVIEIYGADCAARPGSPPMPFTDTTEYEQWMRELVIYADGRTALECYGKSSPFTEAPDLDGRRWHSRPDMVISAIHLLRLSEAPQYEGRVRIMGDTLPNALKGKSGEWMDRLPKLTDLGEVTGFGNALLEDAA